MEKKVSKKLNKPAIKREIHEIDATDQSFGRLATKIAVLLRGKNKADFTPHIDGGDLVVVSNASKMRVTGKNKMDNKVYYHHSGYPGGLKAKTMAEVWKKDPSEVLKRATWNMLPKNKLRNNMIKRLKITN